MSRGESAARYELEFEDGPRRGEVVPVDRAVVQLGRQLTNDVVLADERVSRQHAQIEEQADGLFITDNASSNGTYVNGVPISVRTRLEPGYVVEIGSSRMLVRGTGAGPAQLNNAATMIGSYGGQNDWGPAAASPPPTPAP